MRTALHLELAEPPHELTVPSTDLSMKSGVEEDDESVDERRGDREAESVEKMPVFSLVYTSTTCEVVGSIVIMTLQS